MDHARIEWLQSELSKHFSQLTGKEVQLTRQEAVFIATVVWPRTETPAGFSIT